MDEELYDELHASFTGAVEKITGGFVTGYVLIASIQTLEGHKELFYTTDVGAVMYETLGLLETGLAHERREAALLFEPCDHDD